MTAPAVPTAPLPSELQAALNDVERWSLYYNVTPKSVDAVRTIKAALLTMQRERDQYREYWLDNAGDDNGGTIAERDSLREQLAASERTCAELRASIDRTVTGMNELSVQSVQLVDENAKLRAGLRGFVCNDEVCPTLVTFSDGSVVRLAHDTDYGYYLQVETTEE